MGARQHALELLLDDTGDAVVRRDWRLLHDAGLPSQLDHRSASNSPHLTLVEAPRLSAVDEERAEDLLAPLLPRPARVAGLVLLGGRRPTLARLLEIDDALMTAVLSLRAGVAGSRHPGWVPHVTLARRLPRDRVAEALAALQTADPAVDPASTDPESLTLATLRRWDPAAAQPVE